MLTYGETVKKKSENRKQNKSSSNNSATKKPTDNSIDLPIAKPKYQYELQIMNGKDKNLYNDSEIVIYIKTNNPNPAIFKADCGTGKLVQKEDENRKFYTIEDEFREVISPNIYNDVHYTGSKALY